MAKLSLNMPLKENKIAIVLVNLGTPIAPNKKAVKRFLMEFLSDPRVIDFPSSIYVLWKLLLRGVVLPIRVPRVTNLYKSIWLPEGSPLRVIGERLASTLENYLQEAVTVEVKLKSAMTYGSPAITQVLDELLNSGFERICVLPLFPQYSSTVTGAVYDKILGDFNRKRVIPELHFIRDYYSEEHYLKAMAKHIQNQWQQREKGKRLLFSFHGIPQQYNDEGDPYALQCQQTAKWLAEYLNLNDDAWGIAFQSRFGPTKWVKPYTDEVLKQWAQEGVDSVDIISPGFAIDCLETLEELAIRNRETFLSHGGKEYHYISALNDQLLHASALGDILIKRIQGWIC